MQDTILLSGSHRVHDNSEEIHQSFHIDDPPTSSLTSSEGHLNTKHITLIRQIDEYLTFKQDQFLHTTTHMRKFEFEKSINLPNSQETVECEVVMSLSMQSLKLKLCVVSAPASGSGHMPARRILCQLSAITCANSANGQVGFFFSAKTLHFKLLLIVVRWHFSSPL